MKVTITYEDERGTEVKIVRALDVKEIKTHRAGGRVIVEHTSVDGDRTYMNDSPYPDGCDPFVAAQCDLVGAAAMSLIKALGYDGAELELREKDG